MLRSPGGDHWCVEWTAEQNGGGSGARDYISHKMKCLWWHQRVVIEYQQQCRHNHYMRACDKRQLRRESYEIETNLRHIPMVYERTIY